MPNTNAFTDEQIAEILQQLNQHPGARLQYIGSRYVPKFADPAEWDNTQTYEPLTIVLNEGNSFTSKQFVPVGVDINNAEYWAETGNYNAQVEQYRQEVLGFDQRITDNANRIALINQAFTTPEEHGAKKDGVTDDSTAINAAIQTGVPVVFSEGTYLIASPIVINAPVTLIGAGHTKTIITANSAITMMEISPSSNSIAEKGFTVDGLFLNGNNNALYGIYYNNDGQTSNYISRWKFSNMRIENCTTGIEFTNQEVADGYFIGGFERMFIGSPVIFNRAGDSWYIRDSQFYEEGYVEVRSIASGARMMGFVNNNFVADHFTFNGNGLYFAYNQFEPQGLPAISITGYGNTIFASTVNSHSDDSGKYLIAFDNGLGVANQGSENTIISCDIVKPTNSGLISANDKVCMKGAKFYQTSGPIMKRSEYAQYFSGQYIDGANIEPSTVEGVSVTRNYSYYNDGIAHITCYVTFSEAQTVNNSTLLLNLANLFNKNQYGIANSYNSSNELAPVGVQTLGPGIYAFTKSNTNIDNVTTIVIRQDFETSI